MGMSAEYAPEPSLVKPGVKLESESDELDNLAEDYHSTDSLGDYLREIGKVPLLDAAQEVELAKRIEAGLFAGRLKSVLESSAPEDLSEPEQTLYEKYADGPSQFLQDLENLVEDGVAAKRHLVAANLRLVVSVAKRYRNMSTMTTLDLCQEGNIGLIRAVEKFDYTKGYKFSTYAMWWIRQAIGRALADQDRTVRLPVHVVEKVNKLKRTERELTKELNTDPTVGQLAERMEWDVEAVEEHLSYHRNQPISFSKPLNSRDEGTVEDLLADTADPRPDDTVEFMGMALALKEALAGLTEREARVLSLRFGLGTGVPHTLEEVGEDQGLTRERVRQIEKEALKKLGQNNPDLKDFLA